MDTKITELNVQQQVGSNVENNQIALLSDFQLMLIGGGSGDVAFG